MGHCRPADDRSAQHHAARSRHPEAAPIGWLQLFLYSFLYIIFGYTSCWRYLSVCLLRGQRLLPRWTLKQSTNPTQTLCEAQSVRMWCVRAAPAEVSHPLLTMALLAPAVTCELGNERRGGAVIYITGVRVLRTWTHLISPRLISLPDQMGMHNTSDSQ